MHKNDELWTRSVALYSGFADNEPKVFEPDPGDLVELLTSHPEPTCSACIGKDCAHKKSRDSWSPVSLREGATRSNDAVEWVNYCVIDLDHLAPGRLAELLASICEYECVAYSTHSHAPKDECYRLVLPLSRPCPAADWRRVLATVVEALALPADPVCKDLSRLYALPDSRVGVLPFAAHQPGAPIDLDEVYEALGVRRDAPPKEGVAAPPQAEVDLSALRRRLSEVRRSKAARVDPKEKEKAAILGRVLDGEPLAALGERDSTILRAVAMLAYHLPIGTPWEAVLELLRPSLAAMPRDASKAEAETFEYLARVAQEKFAKKVVERQAFEERRAAETARVDESIKAAVERARDAGRAEPTAADVGEDWIDLLITNKQGIRACEYNTRLALACHPDVAGTISWNEVTKEIEVLGGALGGIPTSTLHTAAAGWLQRHVEVFVGARVAGAGLLQVARENPRDPVSEYLNELTWDGVPRLDAFLQDYCSAEVTNREEYVRVISRRWLISLVARALCPGCQVDNVLVLEGEQGVGKSSVLRALAGPEWFVSTSLALGDKDCMQLIASAWIVELGELASFRRAETERVKQFFTNRIDKYRPPYGAVVEAAPRRCVFVGTTNSYEGYLLDRSGNRRYWPVRVGKIDIARVERDREQILAEAVAAYHAGERWHLVGEEVALAAGEAEDRLDTSTVEEAVERWWCGMAPEKRPRRLSMLDVVEALQVPKDRVDHAFKIELGSAMRRLGFRRSQRNGSEGSRIRYYEPGEALLGAPKGTTLKQAQVLALVSAVKKPEKK